MSASPRRGDRDSDFLFWLPTGLWHIVGRELTDSRKRTRSASPRQGVQVWVLVWGSACADVMKCIFFILVTGVLGFLSCRGRRPRRPEDTFFLLSRLLSDPKRGKKSFKRAFLPLKKLLPRARVSRTSHAWQVCAAKGKAKVNSFATLRGFNYTTRANIAHEEAEQIRARIACTPAEKR